jgi:hypothetical protein
VVTTVGADEKVQNVVLPRYTEAASKALWKPLYDQLRQRLVKRGLDKAMMLGMITDAWPTKEEVAFLAEMAPGAPWVAHAHFGAGANVYQLAPTGYQVRVWSISPPGEKSLMGWRQAGLYNRYFRQGEFDHYPSAMWRHMFEYAICGDQRGVGRLGAEFWPVIRDKAGQPKGRIYARYPQSNWRNLDIYTALLAPMPTNVALTTRYEHLRQGVQECEARIVVERAVTDEALKSRLGPELVERCQKALNEHLLALQMVRGAGQRVLHALSGYTDLESAWFMSCGWEQRAENLFTLAGEVERITVGTPKP